MGHKALQTTATPTVLKECGKVLLASRLSSDERDSTRMRQPGADSEVTRYGEVGRWAGLDLAGRELGLRRGVVTV